MDHCAAKEAHQAGRGKAKKDGPENGHVHINCKYAAKYARERDHCRKGQVDTTDKHDMCQTNREDARYGSLPQDRDDAR